MIISSTSFYFYHITIFKKINSFYEKTFFSVCFAFVRKSDAEGDSVKNYKILLTFVKFYFIIYLKAVTKRVAR